MIRIITTPLTYSWSHSNSVIIYIPIASLLYFPRTVTPRQYTHTPLQQAPEVSFSAAEWETADCCQKCSFVFFFACACYLYVSSVRFFLTHLVWCTTLSHLPHYADSVNVRKQQDASYKQIHARIQKKSICQMSFWSLKQQSIPLRKMHIQTPVHLTQALLQLLIPQKLHPTPWARNSVSLVFELLVLQETSNKFIPSCENIWSSISCWKGTPWAGSVVLPSSTTNRCTPTSSTVLR